MNRYVITIKQECRGEHSSEELRSVIGGVDGAQFKGGETGTFVVDANQDGFNRLQALLSLWCYIEREIIYAPGGMTLSAFPIPVK